MAMLIAAACRIFGLGLGWNHTARQTCGHRFTPEHARTRSRNHRGPARHRQTNCFQWIDKRGLKIDRDRGSIVAHACRRHRP
ncbi:hypothetical protein [Lysobacter gummosus]|uniref:hypothetical protein n=1 Tax=Lysobacter gummosus TaxID=262324 RepID=UPI0036383C55